MRSAYTVLVTRPYRIPAKAWSAREDAILYDGNDEKVAMLIHHAYLSLCDLHERVIVRRHKDGAVCLTGDGSWRFE